MPAEVILALDQGSSSTRCVAFDRRLQPRGSAVRPVSTSRPSPGLVEHDPGELLAGALEAVSEVVAGAGGAVAGIGIASQTESFVLWERDTGRAVTPVVSWQDQRADELCVAIGRRPEAASVRATTGLALDPTFSAPKLAWLFAADPALEERAEAGELLFGDVACWLAWHLGGGAAHVTEPSNACRSLLVDLETLSWDPRLLDLFGVPAALLPEIRPSDDPGVQASAAVVGFEAPLAALLGDQPAALYGQGCTSPRMATLTLGTGAFLWLNVGAERPEPPPGVLATAAWERAGLGDDVRARGLLRERRQRAGPAPHAGLRRGRRGPGARLVPSASGRRPCPGGPRHSTLARRRPHHRPGSEQRDDCGRPGSGRRRRRRPPDRRRAGGG